MLVAPGQSLGDRRGNSRLADSAWTHDSHEPPLRSSRGESADDLRAAHCRGKGNREVCGAGVLPAGIGTRRSVGRPERRSLLPAPDGNDETVAATGEVLFGARAVFAITERFT